LGCFWCKKRGKTELRRHESNYEQEKEMMGGSGHLALEVIFHEVN
jgi:hypothetical protein